jgi:hypothetical protein
MSGIGIALSAVSVAIAIGTSAAAGAASAKSKKAAREAERVAKAKVEEAKKELQRMPYQELSLDLQGFKAEQEASQVAAAMAMQAAQDAETRGLAAAVGRTQMADIAQQRDARLDKASDLKTLEQLKAKERQEASDKLYELNLAEAEGAQIAAAEYESQAAGQTQSAINSGLQAVQGAANLAGSIAAPKMEAAAAFDQNLSGASEADLKQMLSTNPDAAANLDIPNLTSGQLRKAFIKYEGKNREMWTNEDYLSGFVTPASTRNLNPANYE